MEHREILDRLSLLDTPCLCDADRSLRVMSREIRLRSGARVMAGTARTVRVKDDFLGVIEALGDSLPGEVLVVDGGGGGLALAGELFASEARRRGLAGLVVDGAVRDTGTIADLDLPVYSRWITPMAGTKVRSGEDQIEIRCGGVTVKPGEIIFGDRDGIVVVSGEELESIIAKAEAIQAREADILSRIRKGEDLTTMR
ncbi:MAG: RraA family protein [Candidatus Obscuribacterales bacterium]